MHQSIFHLSQLSNFHEKLNKRKNSNKVDLQQIRKHPFVMEANKQLLTNVTLLLARFYREHPRYMMAHQINYGEKKYQNMQSDIYIYFSFYWKNDKKQPLFGSSRHLSGWLSHMSGTDGNWLGPNLTLQKFGLDFRDWQIYEKCQKKKKKTRGIQQVFFFYFFLLVSKK